MLLGVLVATSGFTLLTGAVETSRLQVSGTVDEHFRAAYDILVRPAGSRTPLEVERGLVRPNFLSGQFGGITTEEYERIAALPGVEVAAPVAMIGYVPVVLSTELDLTPYVDRLADRQLLRVRRVWHTDRGLSRFDDPGAHYVYLTRREVVWPSYDPTGHGTLRFAGYRRGGEKLEVDVSACVPGPENWPLRHPPVEILPDGTAEPICDLSSDPFGQAGLEAAERTRMDVVHVRRDGRFERAEPRPPAEPFVDSRLVITVEWPVNLLLAAIDPVQEARLVGLDGAIVSGRYLRPDDGPRRRGSTNPEDPDFDPRVDIPMLLSVTAQVDEQLTSVVEDVDTPPTVAGVSFDELPDRLGGLPGEPVAEHTTDAEQVYREESGNLTARINFTVVLQSGQPTYQRAGDTLRPVAAEAVLADLWVQELAAGMAATPVFATDTAFRPMDRVPERRNDRFPGLQVVGTFDPYRLVEFSPLSQVPLESYQPARATGAADATRRLLGGEQLLPNSNPGGYLATPPQLLTTFAALDEVLSPAHPSWRAPISAIRIRVADHMAGVDPQSQRELHRLAEQVITATGLEVDITIGSSPGPQVVNLPAGAHGRPELSLVEGWSHKGLAVALVREIDRKSLALFGLILVACALFLGNAVSASVRVRRHELGVLSCLGWPRHRITGLIVSEVLTVALAAGAISTLLALPVAAAVGIHITWLHALLAIPVAVALALAAGLVPALRASGHWPDTALRPPVLATGRARRRRHVAGLATANLTRVPGRSLAAITALAVGVAAVTALLLITRQFHGQAQGTLLGDFVSIQVRGVDLAAALTTVVLGVLATADALYLNIRERAAELATLRACGWSDSELGRLIIYEGTLLGLVAATLGGAAGLAVIAWFTGTVTATAVTTAVAIAAGGTALTSLAASIPAQLMRGLPLSTLLAED